MTISPTAYIILGASIGVALLIMIIAWIWMRWKTNVIKKKYAQDNKDKVINKKPRENYGKLLWELKNKTTNPLDDAQLEFILNSAWLNGYQSFKLFNFKSNYEEESLKKLNKMQVANENPDLVIINNNGNFNKLFDQNYQTLAPKKMLIITNANRKEKAIKEFIKYLHLIQVRYEWQNYGKGLILVVK